MSDDINPTTTPKPTYVDRLDLHEIPESEMPRGPLNRRFCVPLAHLTQRQQKIMHRALRRSLRIVDHGE